MYPDNASVRSHPADFLAEAHYFVNFVFDKLNEEFMSSIPEIICGCKDKGFSFEVLPPLKGKGIEHIFNNIETLLQWCPLYINITTHRSEMVYKSTPDGLYEKVTERSRPGTVAVAAAIQHRYNLPAVPHMICSGYTRAETEYALIDLNFLGISNLLLLRGDKAKHDSSFQPSAGGYSHATELQAQVNEFNRGCFLDGTKMDIITGERFSYGVAGYPEKHAESPNMEMDMQWLKAKVDAGAEYIVTQMFFDNSKYFSFVERCRTNGINVPIIPGIKPIINLRQLTLIPQVFSVDIPVDFARELAKCHDDKEAKEAGVVWCASQVKELYDNGVKSIHFYSHNAVESVRKVLERVL